MKKLITLITCTLILIACENKMQKASQSIETQNSEQQKSTESNTITDTVQNVVQPAKNNDLFSDVTGNYLFQAEVADCKITLTLFSENGILKYKMKTNTKEYSGNAVLSKDENNDHITFENIEWSENLGFIDPEGETAEKDLPLPQEILSGFREDEIIFQNYGNAASYYVVLGDCDVKYIHLKKQ